MVGVDEAISIILARLKSDPERCGSQYGYDVWLPNIWEDYVRDRDGLPRSEYHAAAKFGDQLSPPFFAAAWELCRRGILRPGVTKVNTQVTDTGQGGSGYSLTPMGRDFLESAPEIQFVPTEPNNIAIMFGGFHEAFGDGYEAG